MLVWLIESTTVQQRTVRRQESSCLSSSPPYHGHSAIPSDDITQFCDDIGDVMMSVVCGNGALNRLASDCPARLHTTLPGAFCALDSNQALVMQHASSLTALFLESVPGITIWIRGWIEPRLKS